jgi:hypothetical protein
MSGGGERVELETFLADQAARGLFVDQGSFRVDSARAMEKLSRFALPDPDLWVVKLVQAAVVAGAPEIVFRLERRRVVVEFANQAGWSAAQILTDLMEGRSGSDSGLRHLQAGLLAAAMGLSQEICWSSAGQQVRLSADGVRCEAVEPTPQFRVVTNRTLPGKKPGLLTTPLRYLWHQTAGEYKALVERCRCCPIAVVVDGLRLRPSYRVTYMQLPMDMSCVGEADGHKLWLGQFPLYGELEAPSGGGKAGGDESSELSGGVDVPTDGVESLDDENSGLPGGVDGPAGREEKPSEDGPAPQNPSSTEAQRPQLAYPLEQLKLPDGSSPGVKFQPLSMPPGPPARAVVNLYFGQRRRPRINYLHDGVLLGEEMLWGQDEPWFLALRAKPSNLVLDLYLAVGWEDVDLSHFGVARPPLEGLLEELRQRLLQVLPLLARDAQRPWHEAGAPPDPTGAALRNLTLTQLGVGGFLMMYLPHILVLSGVVLLSYPLTSLAKPFLDSRKGARLRTDLEQIIQALEQLEPDPASSTWPPRSPKENSTSEASEPSEASAPSETPEPSEVPAPSVMPKAA